MKHTTISCEHNEPPASECGLEPTFAILNNYNGIISPKIHMETWQVGALVDITFRETISIGQTWGAELVGEPDDDGLSIIDEGLRGGVRPSTGYTLRFRLMPLARGLPPERKDSFGFEASPPFHSMPSISCILQKRLPPPPPPSPPSPSPPPPQRKLVDENDCFLGGRMAFVKPPTQVGVPWLIDVTLVHWVPDVLLTLNFVGDSAHELEGHPLQIDSVRPPEAVWMDAQTKHSVTYRLRPVPGGDPGALHIVAFGKVTGLGQVTCCCAPPPPPPPPEVDPPPLPPPPSAKPEPPPPPPFSHIKGLEIDGHEERVIQRVTEEPKVSNTSGGWTQNVFLWVVAALLIYFYGSKWLKQLREHLRFVRMKKDVQKRFGVGGGRLVPDHDEEEEELGNGVELEGGWGGRSIDAEAAAKKKKPSQQKGGRSDTVHAARGWQLARDGARPEEGEVDAGAAFARAQLLVRSGRRQPRVADDGVRGRWGRGGEGDAGDRVEPDQGRELTQPSAEELSGEADHQLRQAVPGRPRRFGTVRGDSFHGRPRLACVCSLNTFQKRQ